MKRTSVNGSLSIQYVHMESAHGEADESVDLTDDWVRPQWSARETLNQDQWNTCARDENQTDQHADQNR